MSGKFFDLHILWYTQKVFRRAGSITWTTWGSRFDFQSDRRCLWGSSLIHQPRSGSNLKSDAQGSIASPRPGLVRWSASNIACTIRRHGWKERHIGLRIEPELSSIHSSLLRKCLPECFSCSRSRRIVHHAEARHLWTRRMARNKVRNWSLDKQS